MTNTKMKAKNLWKKADLEKNKTIKNQISKILIKLPMFFLRYLPTFYDFSQSQNYTFSYFFK